MPGYAFNEPFAEQVEFLRKKVDLPSQRWDDISLSAHDRAFMVAGAQTADLLHDLHNAVNKAVTEGKGLEAFRKDFKALVAKNGWSGWTGEGSKAGEAWRTKVIYQTNMATSYAAGRYAQLTNPDLLKVKPYWRYVHNDSVVVPRPLHESWNDLILPATHEFWKKHFPPNGWGCGCDVRAVGKAEFEQAQAAGRGPDTAPDADDVEGLDSGFEYAPGAGVDLPLRDAVEKKLITYPPAIRQALSADVNAHFAERAPEQARRLAMPHANGEAQQDGVLAIVGDGGRLAAALGHDVTGAWAVMDGKTVRTILQQPIPDSAQANARLPRDADFAHLAELINRPDLVELLTGEPPVLALELSVRDEILRGVFVLDKRDGRTVLALREFLIRGAA